MASLSSRPRPAPGDDEMAGGEMADVKAARAIPLANRGSDPLAAASTDGPTNGSAHGSAEGRATGQEASERLGPGRALALSDFSPPEISAAERFVRFAYRLGVPGSTLAAPFRKPPKLRLLATVETPLAGDRVSGVALRAGHFLVHGLKAPIAQVDFAPAARLAPPLERMVHGFEWLRDLAASAPREQCMQTAETILSAWLDANPRPGRGAAWNVGNAGKRLLGWMVHAPLILSGPDKALRARVLSCAAETARWLDRNISRAEARHGM